MARRRKDATDPRQMTLFEVTAQHIEELRQEAEKDPEDCLRLRPLPPRKPRKAVRPKPEPQKQHSLFDVVPTEAPITVKTEETQHDRPANEPLGTGQPRSRTGNNQGNQVSRGIEQMSLLDPGSLGAERAGSPEETRTGRQESDGVDISRIRSGRDGRAGTVQRRGDTDAHERHVELGNPGSDGRRYEARNYRITAADELGSGSAAVKFEDNIRAITVLKGLIRDNAEVASPEEQKALVRYVGWGGLPQAFDAKNERWREQYHKVQSLLSSDEYAQARRSTQDAHYTSETVIRGIYQGLARLGVGKGKDTAPLQILEPSTGIGNFLGLCPPEWEAKFTAVERDPLSSQILRYLYPKEKLRVFTG